MKLTYPGPLPGVHIVEPDITVDKNTEFEVDDDLGRQLVKQGFIEVKPAKVGAKTADEGGKG